MIRNKFFNLPALVITALILSGDSGQGAQVIGSPEGTATSFVSENGPLVYAPRSARAQKVIFDTPEKQLIYAPDTPFRRFFDSRAQDFDDGKVEYAKTTVLSDIVARLRSREFIKGQVGEVVERYKSRLISSKSDIELVDVGITETLSLGNTKPSFEDTKQALTAIIAQHSDIGIRHDLTNSLLGAKDLTEARTKYTARAKTSPKLTEAQQQKLVDDRANLLVDVLYRVLLQDNYPDVDDEEISGIVARAQGKDWLWMEKVFKPAFQNELEERLKQRDWLRIVVQQAVAKRQNLFRKGGSPVDGLREAEESFRKLAEKTAFSPTFREVLFSDNLSLWQGFLNHLNSHPTTKTNRYLLQAPDNRSRRMDADELRAFGIILRPAVIEAFSKQPFNAEPLQVLLSRADVSRQLCPEGGTGKDLATLLAESRTLLQTNLTNVASILSSYTVFTNKLSGTNQAESATSIGALTTQIVDQLSSINNEPAMVDRFGTNVLADLGRANLSNYFNGSLSRTNNTNPPTLFVVVTNALTGSLPLSVHQSRARIITDLQSAFQGLTQYVGSDDAVLAAFLRSDEVKFSSPEFRRRAVSTVPKRFYAEASKANATNVSEVFNRIVEDPEVAFLFGSGLANPQVIEAFKEEFYSAFQEPKRLLEALKAEKEADYEYWWLTFYPKAVPLGAKKLAGDSIIEISFPEAVVPEVQYHRWLQDSALDGYSKGKQSGEDPQKRPEKVKSIVTDVPGGMPANLRLRNATALIRDTLNVLEATELKARFTEVRPTMLKALDEFTAPRNSEDERYWSGIRTLYEDVFPEDRVWLSALATHTDNYGVGSDGFLTIQRARYGAFVLDLAAIRAQTNSVEHILHKLRYQVGAAGGGVTGDLGRMFARTLRATDGTETTRIREAFADELSVIWKDAHTNLDSRVFELRLGLKQASKAAKDVEALPELRKQIDSHFSDALEETYAIKETQTDAPHAIRVISTNLIERCNAGVRSFQKQNAQDKGNYLVTAVAEDLEHQIAYGLKNAVSMATNQPKKSRASEYEQQVREELRAFGINFYLKLPPDAQVMASLRNKLKNLEFGKMHVLFSVMAVTETKARLPEKMNLFTWAGSQGVMIFNTPTNEISSDKTLLKHAVDYYNHSAPLRGDKVDSLSGINVMSLQGMQADADLFALILNAYFSSYPDVPSKQSIREAYFDDGNERLRALTYNWLDHYGVLYHQPLSPSLLKRLGSQSFLTPKCQGLLFGVITNSFVNDSKQYRRSMTNAVKSIFTEPENIALVYELDEHLFDNYYASVWKIAEMIEETERHAVPYKSIQKEDFRTFRSWARPSYQKGIQIVDMLPASRDDLVAMSINEGGVVARLAGQAEGSAAYDLNYAKMAERFGQSATSRLNRKLLTERQITTNAIGSLRDDFGEDSSRNRREIFRDMAELGKTFSSQGYSLGATADGSAYARARAAMSYSHRREYLDAAITAAGRGDNFAKWVVRHSDFRSDLAKSGGKKLVAAAHNGFPNGDQPFHMLVKIPNDAIKQDWKQRNYIYFQSTYVATKQISFWRTAGLPGLIAKTPFAAFNPYWWNDIEKSIVGTHYPFVWDVRTEREQTRLLQEPSFLGGEIWLDDTDKIKHSEVLEMVQAEDAFIRVTKDMQKSELSTVMADIGKESETFSKAVRTDMKEHSGSLLKDFSDAENEPTLTNRIHRLEQELNDLKSRATPEQASP